METTMLALIIWSALMILYGTARFVRASRNYRARRNQFDYLMQHGNAERRRAPRPANSPVYQRGAA